MVKGTQILHKDLVIKCLAVNFVQAVGCFILALKRNYYYNYIFLFSNYLFSPYILFVHHLGLTWVVKSLSFLTKVLGLNFGYEKNSSWKRCYPLRYPCKLPQRISPLIENSSKLLKKNIVCSDVQSNSARVILQSPIYSLITLFIFFYASNFLQSSL